MIFNYDDCTFEAYERDGYMYYREVSQGGDPLYDFQKLEWYLFDYQANSEDLVEILEAVSYTHLTLPTNREV